MICIDGNDHVYLCQVSDTVSCGACCGLYNVRNPSRKKLEILLLERTDAFASVPRTEFAIYEFQKRNQGPHPRSRPFPEFYHCPFLGLIGGEKCHVGCLLHPTAPGNNGIDYRSLSWYGEQACRTYFCPTTLKLPAVYKSMLLLGIDNWYDFGLLVTEHILVTAFFKEVESRLGRHITVGDYKQSAASISAFRGFAELKSKWPYRRSHSPGPCNYFFENGLYPRAGVFRATPDIRLSSYETILGELDSGFSSPKELAEAEKLLDDLFFKFILLFS